MFLTPSFWTFSQNFPILNTVPSFSPPALTRCPRWRHQCWWFTAPRTRSSTSPTAWPCTSAAPAPSSPCGWREPATTTSNCTPSTWRDSSSSSPSSCPPLEGGPRLSGSSSRTQRSLLVISQLPLGVAGGPQPTRHAVLSPPGPRWRFCEGMRVRVTDVWRVFRLVRCSQMRGQCGKTLTCCVPPPTLPTKNKTLACATPCGRSLPMKPGLDGVFTGRSIWIHFPLRLSASSPSSTNSSTHFLCPHPMISARHYFLFSLPPSLTFSFSWNILQCSSLSFVFCIFYGWSINFALLQIQVKFSFSGNTVSVYFYLPFRVNQILALYRAVVSGNVFSPFPAFERAHGYYLIDIPRWVAGGLRAGNLSVLLYLWPFVAVICPDACYSLWRGA